MSNIMLPSPLIKFKCSAPGCDNAYMPGCVESFFAFPKEPTRCQKWIHFCGLEDRYRVARDVGATVKLCSKHFNKSECYTNGRRRFLVRTAVPTIHSNGTVLEQESSGNDTALEQESSESPRAASPTSQSSVTLSPLHNPPQRHKVLRTYARRVRLGKSTVSSGGKFSSICSQVSDPSAKLPDSPKDSKMELKDAATTCKGDLIMNLKKGTFWLDQTPTENKLMAVDYYDKDAELNKIISFASVFTIKSENNIGIYDPDHDMNPKIEIKDEPNADTDLHDEIQDTYFWKDGIDQDFPAAEPPR